MRYHFVERQFISSLVRVDIVQRYSIDEIKSHSSWTIFALSDRFLSLFFFFFHFGFVLELTCLGLGAFFFLFARKSFYYNVRWKFKSFTNDVRKVFIELCMDRETQKKKKKKQSEQRCIFFRSFILLFIHDCIHFVWFSCWIHLCVKQWFEFVITSNVLNFLFLSFSLYLSLDVLHQLCYLFELYVCFCRIPCNFCQFFFFLFFWLYVFLVSCPFYKHIIQPIQFNVHVIKAHSKWFYHEIKNYFLILFCFFFVVVAAAFSWLYFCFCKWNFMIMFNMLTKMFKFFFFLKNGYHYIACVTWNFKLMNLVLFLFL